MNLKDVNKIVEGWRNSVIPPEELREVISVTQAERLAICRACPLNSKNRPPGIRFDEYCVQCGCTLSAKTACLSCKCPLPEPKWEAVYDPATIEAPGDQGDVPDK